MRLFQNRREAAEELARLLTYLKPEKPIVLGLANAGVAVAEVIAEALDAPLDVLLIERLAAPKHPDHIVGAVDEHGRISMIKSTARWHHLTSKQMIEPARLVFRDLQRRRGTIRAVLPEMEVRDRTVVVVSQGIATGAKMLGAVSSVRDRGARKVVAAAPAGAGEAAWQLQEAADQVVIPHRPTKFVDIAHLYREFTPVPEELVQAIIERWVRTRPPQQPGVSTVVMKIPNDHGQLLCCEIDLPPGTARGSGPFPTVIFAHRYESDGRNPRTVPISHRLAKRDVIGVRTNFTGHGQSQGVQEDATPAQMASDLNRIIENVCRLHEVDEDRLGLIGAGTGASLVLKRALADPTIRTVVVRGPLCGGELELASELKAPTLVIHATDDAAFARDLPALQGPFPSTHETLEVPDANRLFTDAISLELLVGATVDWMADHLIQPPFHDEPDSDVIDAPTAAPIDD